MMEYQWFWFLTKPNTAGERERTAELNQLIAEEWRIHSWVSNGNLHERIMLLERTVVATER